MCTPALVHEVLSSWPVLLPVLPAAGGLFIVAKRRHRSETDPSVTRCVRKAVGLGLMHQIMRCFDVPQRWRDRAMAEEFEGRREDPP
jgi:hypothetical protein